MAFDCNQLARAYVNDAYDEEALSEARKKFRGHLDQPFKQIKDSVNRVRTAYRYMVAKAEEAARAFDVWSTQATVLHVRINADTELQDTSVDSMVLLHFEGSEHHGAFVYDGFDENPAWFANASPMQLQVWVREASQQVFAGIHRVWQTQQALHGYDVLIRDLRAQLEPGQKYMSADEVYEYLMSDDVTVLVDLGRKAQGLDVGGERRHAQREAI